MSTGASFPFRFDPRPASPEAVAAAPGDGRRGATDVEAVVRRAATARSATATAILTWAWHPEERVPLAFATNAGHEGPLARPVLLARDALYQRARRDAAAAGELWTPLLDRLVAVDLWPVRLDDRARNRAGGADRWAVGAVPDGVAEPHVDLPALMATIRPWVRTCEDPAQLRRLLAYTALDLRALVAGSARVWDDALFQACAADARLLPFLASNRHLAPDQRERLLWHALTCVAGVASLPGAPVGTPPVHDQGGRAAHAADAITRLAADHLMARPAHVDAALLAALVAAEGARQVAAQAAIVRALLPQGLLRDEPLLCALWDRLLPASRVRDVEMLAAHPAADLAFWRHVVATSSDPQVLWHVARRDRACRDDACRAALIAGLGWTDHTTRQLARFATPRELRAGFTRAVADQNLHGAAALLLTGDAERLDALPASAFLALLGWAPATVAVDLCAQVVRCRQTTADAPATPGGVLQLADEVIPAQWPAIFDAFCQTRLPEVVRWVRARDHRAGLPAATDGMLRLLRSDDLDVWELVLETIEAAGFPRAFARVLPKAPALALTHLEARLPDVGPYVTLRQVRQLLTRPELPMAMRVKLAQAARQAAGSAAHGRSA